MSDQLKLPLHMPIVESKWYAQNKWKRLHPLYTKEQKRRWHQRHLEERAVKTKEWKLANPEKAKIIQKRCWDKNKDRYNAIKRELTKSLRLEIITRLGGKCACCGEDTFEFLTVDHINSGGRQHRKRYSGHSIYLIIRREGYPLDKYRCLCYNCNCVRGSYGYCPHEKQSPLAVGLC